MAKNDIIKIHVNCNEGFVKFFNNDKQIGSTVKIVQNTAYHVLMGLQSHRVEYQLIDS